MRSVTVRELRNKGGEVSAICERYGVPYNKGPLPKQFATVIRKICRLALPG